MQQKERSHTAGTTVERNEIDVVQGHHGEGPTEFLGKTLTLHEEMQVSSLGKGAEGFEEDHDIPVGIQRTWLDR
jgi:hypothetical protein